MTAPLVQCDLCGHRRADCLDIDAVIAKAACSSCQDRFAAWISKATPEAREQLWLRGTRIGDQAMELADGQPVGVWAEFFAGIDEVVTGGSAEVEAGARIDVGVTCIEMGMIDEAVAQFAKAMTLTPEPSVRQRALALLFSRSILVVTDIRDVRALLYPA